MCGIAGFIGPDPGVATDAIRAMLPAIAHRGPDDESSEIIPAAGGNVAAFGQRRLAILDLSPAGRQPMTRPDRPSWITFNGEIYNHADLKARLEKLGHRFIGTSDTEVLLHWLDEYGTDGLKDLEGMYTLAWRDAATGRVLLARDPFGIKPLYYATPAAGLVFASEVRAVLASGLVPRRLSKPALATALAYGAVQGPLTIAEGVWEFPAGHFAWCDGGKPAPVRFSRPRVCDTAVDAADVEGTVRGLIERAVASHLRADVPVAVLLSSGIDSTILAAVAGKAAPGLQSFTLGFADQPADSEMGDARATAKGIGLDHRDVWLNGPDTLAATRNWLAGLDQPSVDGLNVYVICEAVRRAGIKVALSGLGSDELFGGYPAFRDVGRLTRFARGISWMPRPARAAVAAATAGRRDTATREKLRDILTGPADSRRVYFHRRRLVSDGGMGRLGVRAADLGLTADYQPAEDTTAVGDSVWMVSEMESRYYQGNMLLRDADGCSMAHGLELRVPFLDQKLAEYVRSLPGRVRLPDGVANKHLLRRAFAPELSKYWNSKPKRGFTLPIRHWLLGPLADLSRASLETLKDSGVVTPAGVDRVWADFSRNPDSPTWTRAFMLVVAGRYLEQTRLN